MRQEQYTINKQGDPEELIVDKMVERFNNPEIPYKIKKTKLLESVGLPIPKTDYFEKTEIKPFKDKISEALQVYDYPIVVRFACVPDRLSMPFFYVEKEMGDEEINKIVEEIYSLFESDASIKYLILQEATPPQKTKDKISGRISFEKGEMSPTQEVLDIYKGARSTGILNNADVNDPNFHTFIKKAGEFLKPIKKLNEDSLIKEEEIREIFNFLNLYREKIETIISVITKSKNKSANDMTISLEFSYRDRKIIFSDIDF